MKALQLGNYTFCLSKYVLGLT
uniref:Uncharacterized protein n=1 Tax=Anguilla anguilla TaxID=7936 RepID=A0A0E9XXP7_ANGAN